MVSVRARSQRISARIGRWPRRIAALACLLLAAGSTLAPPPGRPASATSVPPRLHGGEVAVALPVDVGADLARPGDRVGVLAAAQQAGAPAALVADGLRVLRVSTAEDSLGSSGGSTVVVAVARSDAVRLVRFSAERLVLMVDAMP